MAHGVGRMSGQCRQWGGKRVEGGEGVGSEGRVFGGRCFGAGREQGGGRRWE